MKNHHFWNGSSDSLKKRYKEVLNSLTCHVDSGDYAKIEQRLPYLTGLAKMENRAVSLYDVHRKEFLIKTDGHLDLLGYGGENSPDINDIGGYHSLIHPDDLPFLYDTEIRVYEYLNRIKSPKKKDYKLVYDYRVGSRSGSYIRFLHQMALFELDRDFNSWLLLIISDVLLNYPEDEKPRRFLLDTASGRVCLFNEETGIKSRILTEREKEVTQLKAQGLDSGGIADRLCLSVSTVNNHRQNILRKTASRNMTQAANYLKAIGVL